MPSIDTLIALATAATTLVFIRHVGWCGSHLGNSDFLCLACLLVLLLLWTSSLESFYVHKDGYIDAPTIQGPLAAAAADPVTSSTASQFVPIDTEAFKQLYQMPLQVKDMLEPPLNELVKNARGDSTDPAHDANNLEAIADSLYIQTKDPMVGSVARVVRKDPVGNTVIEDMYTLDAVRFNAMKLEYKQLDGMLATLRKVSPVGYNLLIGSQSAGGSAV